ncbi:MAG: STAS domain-containing protein [Chloroflexi bacterium]|nr:STAS domain-containing protein [Chloroflexota bacterium]
MTKNERMSTRFEVIRGCPVLHISGTLDANAAPAFRHEADELFASGHKNLVMDFEKVTFMDSSGVGALIYALRSMQDQGGKQLWIAGCNEQVQSLLQVTQLDKQLHCAGSLANAIDSWLAAHPH